MRIAQLARGGACIAQPHNRGGVFLNEGALNRDAFLGGINKNATPENYRMARLPCMRNMQGRVGKRTRKALFH
jgi:hypothetical protein